MEEHSARGYSQAILRYVQWLFALISFSLFQAVFSRARFIIYLDIAVVVAVVPLVCTPVDITVVPSSNLFYTKLIMRSSL